MTLCENKKLKLSNTYSIGIDVNKKVNAIHAGKIFDNFDKERGYTMITCACYFPSGSMAIHFQTEGKLTKIKREKNIKMTK